MLEAADGNFDVFITTDKNLRHQQNLAKYNLAVILLPSNSVPVVVAVAAEIEAALSRIQAGDFVTISHPTV